MRRANAGNEQTYGYTPTSQMLEDESQQLEDQLSSKVSALRTLTIDIGTEVRSQNKMLNDMDNDFDKSGGLLASSMNRLKAIAKSGGHRFIFYLLLFALFVFGVCWMIVKFR
ncbi:BET1 homolog [Patella vulgata]|uniref:t-SNARE coiled-coil homology domain-containing protein n=1 Tax=Patella caerulea TaxID=87958 RepID=A0AAN8K999_PATCE|nr:BET1 homolog [Patella vulgata]